MTIKQHTPEEFQAWQRENQDIIRQLGLQITPIDGEWGIVRCPYEAIENGQRVQMVWEAVINGRGDIYNTDPNWVIRFKHGELLAGRPVQASFKTLMHASHISYALEWLHYGCTKKEDAVPPSFVDNLLDIFRTPIYGIKMEWISLKILFLSPFMSQGAIWQMREDYGMAEKELCRGSKAAALAPCMQRIANLMFTSKDKHENKVRYTNRAYPEGVDTNTDKGRTLVGLLNISGKQFIHRMSTEEAAANPVETPPPRSCWWGVLSAALAVLAIVVVVVALSVLFPPLAIPVVTGAILAATASILTPAALGGALLFASGIAITLTCFSSQLPFGCCVRKPEAQAAAV